MERDQRKPIDWDATIWQPLVECFGRDYFTEKIVTNWLNITNQTCQWRKKWYNKNTKILGRISEQYRNLFTI